MIGFQTFSQVLDNRNGEAFTDRPFFNEKFIKQNKLKKLEGSYVYKKSGEVMKSTSYKYVYNFDFDIMHNYMIDSFKHHFVEGTVVKSLLQEGQLLAARRARCLVKMDFNEARQILNKNGNNIFISLRSDYN